MPVMPFFMMSPIQAANFNSMTQGQGNQLNPRLVDAGQYAGKYVLPTRVRNDEAYAADIFQSAFAMLTEVAIDPEVAWPPAPDEEE